MNKVLIFIALLVSFNLGNCAGDRLTYINCAQNGEAQLSSIVANPAIKCEITKITDK